MSSETEGLSFIFQSRITLEFTLFTFCPPAPALRAKLKENSEKGMEIFFIGVTIIA
jgi:hypothetical protein